MAKMGKAGEYVNTVTPATKEMKKLLSAMDTMSEKKAIGAFVNVTKSSCKEDKALLHLQLFVHLPYPDDLGPVLEDPGDFVFLVPGYCSESRISRKVFCDVVVDGELLNHFLQLALFLQNKPCIQELVEGVLSKFLSTENHHDLFPNVIFMLGKIARREMVGDFFLKQFNLLLAEFRNHSLMLKYEKLSTLLRLAGVVCMTRDDYGGVGSDLLELLEEWNFDLSNRIAPDTKNYLLELFQDVEKDSGSERIRIKVLGEIENAISLLQVSSQEEAEWGKIQKTSRIQWSEFIGVHAFLTKSILDKYSASGGLDKGGIPILMDTLTKWEQYRPKLTRTDFHGEIGHFDQFYKILKRFGEKDRDRAELLPKFMEFSYKEIYCSKDGLRIAEKYLLPSGDLATVSAYILTSLKREMMPEECRGIVPPMVKLMVQKMLCSNPEMKLGKLEIIPEIFKDGSHSELILSDFTYHVNNLCSKIGTIEKEEKDVAQIEHYRDLVFSTCLEDPYHTVMALMQHSIASQYFKALTFAKPFLVLPAKTSPVPIGNSCFEKILDNAEDHDPILGSVSDSVSALISKNILSAQDLFDILKKKISSGLISNTPNLRKISKLYQILNSFANALIDQMAKMTPEEKEQHSYTTILQDILRLTLNTKKLTYCVMPKTSGKELLFIRSLCSTTLESLIQAAVGSDPLASLSQEVLKNPHFLSSATLIQIGNVYVRIPHLRGAIASMLQTPNTDDLPKLGTELEFASLQVTLLTLVHGSDAEEWPLILEFFLQVVGTSPSFTHDLGTLINRSLIYAWNNFLSVEAQPALRQYLKFYYKAIQALLKKGLLTLPNQRQSIDYLVCLVKEMHDSFKRRKKSGDKSAILISIQQVMLLALEVLNAIISQDPEQFGTHLRDDVLDSFVFLPIAAGGCEPIRKCILDRAQNFQDPKLITVPGGGDEEAEMKNVADVSNLHGLLRKGVMNIALTD